MRASLTHLVRHKPVLLGLVAAIVLALVGTAGYATLSKTVTVSVDGKSSNVRTFGDNVGEVLASKGIKPTSHDSVVPAVDAPVNDGSQIAVRIGRPLALSIDGASAPSGRPRPRCPPRSSSSACASTAPPSRSAVAPTIDRSGMSLEVTTPKQVALKIADDKVKKHNVPAATVGDLLSEVDAGVDRNDIVRPSRSAELTDGTRVVVTKIGMRNKRVPREAIPASVTEQKDDSMMEGESETVREGSDGVRDVTYKLRFRNGEVVKRTIVKQRVLKQPVASIVKIGTKTEPDPELRQRWHGLGPDRTVRVRWQLGRQHRQRLLRRPAVQPRHVVAPTAARGCRTRTAASSRSPSPSASPLQRAATAPGRTAVPSSTDPYPRS